MKKHIVALFAITSMLSTGAAFANGGRTSTTTVKPHAQTSPVVSPSTSTQANPNFANGSGNGNQVNPSAGNGNSSLNGTNASGIGNGSHASGANGATVPAGNGNQSSGNSLPTGNIIR